jgi:HEAT repeat protein
MMSRPDIGAFWVYPEVGKALRDAEAKEKFAAYLLPALCLALLDPKPEVKIISACRLMELGPKAKTAIQALRNVLLDEDPRVRKAAEIAIKLIESKKPHHLL